MRAPRRQAHQLADWLTRDRASLRAVLLGRRREGKSDLLAQIHELLFATAEGPLPFWFRFAPTGSVDGVTRLALLFATAFCQQMRAFLLRQEEILSEPPGELAVEVGRPGVPLSLSELVHELLVAAQGSMPSDDVVSLASRLPARFAHHEGRPVCHLWDDCHTLNPDSPFISTLGVAGEPETRSSPICFLITGLAPLMRTLLGERAWTSVQLQPFADGEALLLAESVCKSSGIRFNREVWECWFAVSGTSPGWAMPVIEAAGLRGLPLENVEQLGRVYAEELDQGSIGAWLAARWPLPAPTYPSPGERPAEIAIRLTSGAAADMVHPLVEDTAVPTHPASAVNQLNQNLSQGEWLRIHALSVEISVSPVESDWLRLETSRVTMGSARAKARLMQDFVIRARRFQQATEPSIGLTTLSLDAIEEHLLYPSDVNTMITTAAGDSIRVPKIFSVVRESTPAGELFWSFGEATAAKTFKKAHSAESLAIHRVPFVLLLVHAVANPTKAMVAEWDRRLHQEILRPDEQQSSLQTDLWVVVPEGGTLAPTGNERRLTRDTLARLLTEGSAVPIATGEYPPTKSELSGESSVQDIGKRLADLQTRAQLLQQEFRATQIESVPSPPDANRSRPKNELSPAGGDVLTGQADRRDDYLRQTLSLSLMLASADLVATGSGAATREAQRARAELQAQCRQLLDELHARASQTDTPSTS